MRTIIAGSRSITDYVALSEAIRDSGFRITQVLSGGAAGVDAMGEKWASIHRIPLVVFPADWERHGRAAGPLRNEAMAQAADALILLWDGESRGSLNMYNTAKQYGLRTFTTVLDGTGRRLYPSIEVTKEMLEASRAMPNAFMTVA